MRTARKQFERLRRARRALDSRPSAAQHVDICCSTVRIGFSAARGFWKIIDIAEPRRRRNSPWPAWVMSRPSKALGRR